MRTENWQSNTRGLRLVGEGESGSASSPYGPMRAGLTTSHRTQLLVLSELLNDLERRIDELRFRFFTVLDTLSQDIELPAEVGRSFPNIDGTE